MNASLKVMDMLLPGIFTLLMLGCLYQLIVEALLPSVAQMGAAAPGVMPVIVSAFSG